MFHLLIKKKKKALYSSSAFLRRKKKDLWVPVGHITQPTCTYVHIDTWHWLLHYSVVKDGKPKPPKSDERSEHRGRREKKE